MNTLPFDQRLIDQLRGMLDQLAAMRESLYARRAGCACDERGLCSHHGMVYNALQAAADDLARAISEAQREE